MINGLQKVFYSTSAFTFVVVLGVAVVAAISLSLHSSLQMTYKQEGRAEFDRAFVLLSERMNTYVYGLQGLGGIYLATDFQPTPKKLRLYAQYRDFFSNFSGVLGFGFVRAVPTSEIKRYEKNRRQIDSQFRVETLGKRESEIDYLIIENIEPSETNRPAIGKDISSEKHRREAALRAIHEGKPSLTKPIHLVQLAQEDLGFLFFLPLYRQAYTPLTVVERQREIVGLIFAPIVAGSVERYINRRISSFLRLTVYDQPNRGGQMLFGATLLEGGIDFERELTIGGEKWHVSARYHNPQSEQFLSMLPVAMFLFLSMLFIGMCLFVRRLILAHPTRFR